MAYHGPEKIKPVSQSQESDRLQAEWTKAASDAIVAVLKPMVKETPNLLVKSLQPHHFDRMTIDCIDAYVKTRRRQELAEELRGPVPNDPVGDLFRG
jgi:hypothetical protein